MSEISVATEQLINTLKRGREIITQNGASCSSDAGFEEVINKFDELIS